MKTSAKSSATSPGGEQQLRGFIARFTPELQRLIRSLRRGLRNRFPSANELVYDYSRYFVIGYSATEQGIDSVLAIAAGTDGLRLYFNDGARLPDPEKILLGSGKQTRFIWIGSSGTLKLPEVEALLKSAIVTAKEPFRREGRGKLIIKSSLAKRQSKRKPKR
ncbi:MAG TPA: hypothetical protein VMW43_06655 [Bacteroidota bacterium]|nr:hypothetical protein [Bacteroidota bacterium]